MNPSFAAVFRPRPNAQNSTFQVLCLLVALAQTIYTIYDNDSIHFGTGTREVLCCLSSLRWTSETSLAQSKNIWLLLPGELLQNRVKHIPFVENHVLSSLPVFPTLGAKS